MNNIIALKISETESILENLSDYLFEYSIYRDEFKLSEDFYNDFECDNMNINSMESFHEAFMSDTVEKNIYKVCLKSGQIKYLEIKVIKKESKPSVTYYGFINDVTKRKLYEEKLHSYAYKDKLTGISNRRQLIKKLEHAIKNSGKNNVSGAFIFIDLDGFKKVNDQLGHKYGDEVLVEVCDRINKILPESLEFGRLGGDEFAIMIPNLSKIDITSFCEKLCYEVAAVSSYFEKKISVSASIGVSRFPEDSTEINGIVDYADRAMYRSKANGKNGFTFWNELETYRTYK